MRPGGAANGTQSPRLSLTFFSRNDETPADGRVACSLVMSTVLLTDVALAERLFIDVKKLHVLRRRHGWPHVRLGRNDVRFTEQQAEQIIASLTVAQRKPKADDKPKNGLTQRSARAHRRRTR